MPKWRERAIVDELVRQKGKKDINHIMAELVSSGAISGQRARQLISKRVFVMRTAEELARANSFKKDGEFHTASLLFIDAGEKAERAGLKEIAKESYEEAYNASSCSNGDIEVRQMLKRRIAELELQIKQSK